MYWMMAYVKILVFYEQEQTDAYIGHISIETEML
jgi:hypothetical protein